MPRTQPSLDQLPLIEDTWLIGTSHLRVWVKEEDSLPTRPYLILIASSSTGLLCGSNFVPETPTAAQVVDVLFKAMQHPPRQLGKACPYRAKTSSQVIYSRKTASFLQSHWVGKMEPSLTVEHKIRGAGSFSSTFPPPF